MARKPAVGDALSEGSADKSFAQLVHRTFASSVPVLYTWFSQDYASAKDQRYLRFIHSELCYVRKKDHIRKANSEDHCHRMLTKQMSKI